MNSTAASAPKTMPVLGSTNAANAMTANATSHSSATAYVGREYTLPATTLVTVLATVSTAADASLAGVVTVPGAASAESRKPTITILSRSASYGTSPASTRQYGNCANCGGSAGK
jgi:hypothetical protein